MEATDIRAQWSNAGGQMVLTLKRDNGDVLRMSLDDFEVGVEMKGLLSNKEISAALGAAPGF